MSGALRLGDRAVAIRLGAFAALAALAGAQWMRLVASPPAARVALVVALLVASAVALAAIGAARPRRAVAWALGGVAVLAAIAGGLVAVGVPARLLDPGDWDELASGIGRGFSGLAGDVRYPYEGENEWTRRVILAGLPVALALAAALAFWPRAGERGRRAAPLAILVATFGMGATIVGPERPLVWGLLLLAAVGAWLWLPALPRRDAIAAAAMVGAAGAFALPLAGALDSDEPPIDYRQWEIGRGNPTTFNWNHGYGPLDWPREGTALAAMRSERPRYWRAAVLDQFDGLRWRRPEQSFGERLELPNIVEGGDDGVNLTPADSRWVEEIGVTIGPMESEFVLSAGALLTVDGISALGLPNGTTVSGDEPLDEGDSYRALSYAPDPSVRQLRNAPETYEPSLARYTEIRLPLRSKRGGSLIEDIPDRTVEVPLRGTSRGERAARRALAASPYADAHRLARRLAAGEPTAFDAAKAIERHFHSGFAYTERPPDHDIPLAGFLSDSRAGYCQQFSGAMALMLRMVGIPARVVSGFSPGTKDADDEQRFIVKDTDAHSWVEAYFPSIGWVTFDPTPSGAPSSGRLDEAEIASLGEPPSAGFGDDLRRKAFTPGESVVTPTASAAGSAFPVWTIPAALVILGLVGLAGGGAFAAVRRYRYARLSPAAAADAHVRELPVALERLGWPLVPAETLLALEQRLRRSAKLAAARYVARIRAGRFSPTDGATPPAPPLADRRAMREDLTARKGIVSRIRSWLALPPGGPSR